ncbi:MAG: hypothetical protein M3Y29_00205 [Chloroflexota bacterium]|jgi:hypothetical protein|nr:hypothetical protein [Chloroflexota bacterium]
MRAAAFTAGAIVVLGLYLAIAGSLAFGPALIITGMVFIASATGVVLLFTSPSPQR